MAAKPRSCGTCTACCRALAVPSLGKAERESCAHQDKPKGCSIYSSRPAECRAFECLWLRLPLLVGGEHRPDRCGLVLATTQHRDGLPIAIVAHEVVSGAASVGAGRDMLAALAARTVVIVARVDGSRLLRGPREQVERYQRALLTTRPIANEGAR